MGFVVERLSCVDAVDLKGREMGGFERSGIGEERKSERLGNGVGEGDERLRLGI